MKKVSVLFYMYLMGKLKCQSLIGFLSKTMIKCPHALQSAKKATLLLNIHSGVFMVAKCLECCHSPLFCRRRFEFSL